MATSRPAVTVIVPFRGEEPEARAALERLGAVRLGPHDRLLFVDNTAAGVVLEAHTLPASVRVVRAPRRASAYHARNAGAGRARSEWLLFVDADCRPDPRLVEAYFEESIPSRCGAVAGAVIGSPSQRSLAARYARSRGRLDQQRNLQDRYRPMAVTANLLVRATAFAQLGGFCDEARSGADSDLCWRLQEAGWELLYRPRAVVEHHHRERVGALLRQVARDGAGSAWLERRHRGCCPPPRLLHGVLRSLVAALAWTLRGDLERARFRGLDALVASAAIAGRAFGNLAPERGPGRAR